MSPSAYGTEVAATFVTLAFLVRQTLERMVWSEFGASMPDTAHVAFAPSEQVGSSLAVWCFDEPRLSGEQIFDVLSGFERIMDKMFMRPG